MRRHAVILAAALAWLIGIESAEARLDILVDKATQRMLVTQNGYVRYMWPVSTGRDETATPNGVYSPQRLERNWFSTAYYNSPMPYSIFFHNGYAIHGSYAIDRLGGPASHGCIRLHPHHAALLFDLVQQEGPNQTTIEITDDAGPGAPPMLAREIPAERGLYPPVPGIVRARPDGPPMLEREIPAERGLYPPVPGIVRGRPDGPPMLEREIPAERGLYPPAPGIVRGRPDGPPMLEREIPAERGLYPPVPGIMRARPDGPPMLAREIPTERGLYPPVPGIMRARPDGPPMLAREIPAERGLYQPVPGIMRARPDGPPMLAREIPAERGLYPPVPGIIRYRENGDMPELPPAQRGNRPIAAKNPLLPLRPTPAPPPVSRRLLSEVKPSANVPRAPCEADTVSGAPRPSDNSSDCRPKPKVAEASPPEQAQQPQKSQQAPPSSGFKLLPASCWSGGASRWRWWGSSQGTPCK